MIHQQMIFVLVHIILRDHILGSGSTYIDNLQQLKQTNGSRSNGKFVPWISLHCRCTIQHIVYSLVLNICSRFFCSRVLCEFTGPSCVFVHTVHDFQSHSAGLQWEQKCFQCSREWDDCLKMYSLSDRSFRAFRTATENNRCPKLE